MFNFRAPEQHCTGIDKLVLAAQTVDESANNTANQMATSNTVEITTPIQQTATTSTFHHRTPRLISTPTCSSEWELYRLLERANLLRYFSTFLEFGGDDVQQLSDADEEEFIEIMCLVGMNQKPLHIRRLQKALVEWRDRQEVHHTRGYRLQQPQPYPLCQPIETSTSSSLYNHYHHNNNPAYQSSSDRHQLAPLTFMQPREPSAFSRLAVSNASDEREYFNPREVIANAPKRPRLMDEFHRRRTDLPPFQTATNHEEESTHEHSGINHQRQDDQDDEDDSDLDGNDDQSFVDVLEDDSPSEEEISSEGGDADDELQDSSRLDASSNIALNLSEKK